MQDLFGEGQMVYLQHHYYQYVKSKVYRIPRCRACLQKQTICCQTTNCDTYPNNKR